MCLVAQFCLTLCNPMECNLPGSSVHGVSPGQNTGVGCHALLQGIFLTQVWNCVSCTAGGFFNPEQPGKPSHIFQVHDFRNSLSMLISGWDQPGEQCLSANSSTDDGFQSSVLSHIYSLKLGVCKLCSYGSHSGD